MPGPRSISASTTSVLRPYHACARTHAHTHTVTRTHFFWFLSAASSSLESRFPVPMHLLTSLDNFAARWGKSVTHCLAASICSCPTTMYGSLAAMASMASSVERMASMASTVELMASMASTVELMASGHKIAQRRVIRLSQYLLVLAKYYVYVISLVMMSE